MQQKSSLSKTLLTTTASLFALSLVSLMQSNFAAAKETVDTDTGQFTMDGQKVSVPQSPYWSEDIITAHVPGATPQQVAAIFCDFNSHATYFKEQGMDSSAIIAGEGTSHPLVAYVGHGGLMGITVTDNYQTQETLTSSNGTYKLEWDVTESEQLYDTQDADEKHTYSRGSGVFAPDGHGGTNVTYTNLASPHNRAFISWADGMVYQTTYDTVKTGVKEVLNQVASGSIQPKIDALEAALQN